jgi:hypothetical protein
MPAGRSLRRPGPLAARVKMWPRPAPRNEVSREAGRETVDSRALVNPPDRTRPECQRSSCPRTAPKGRGYSVLCTLT